MTGLVRLGVRDYDPRSGRFTTPDPALFDAGDPNLYRYVSDDPVSFRDPFGLDSISASFYEGIGLGGSVSWDRDGVSVCVETGVGVGASVDISPTKGIDREGFSARAEAEAGVGWFSVTASIASDVGEGCHPLELNARARLLGAAFDLSDGLVSPVQSAWENLQQAAEGAKPKFGWQAKAVIQQCFAWH